MLQNMRIGRKLGLQATLGAVLVAGLVTNQQWSSRAIADLTEASSRSGIVVSSVMNLDAIASRIQVANRDIRLSRDADGLNSAVGRLPELQAQAKSQTDTALAHASLPANRERLIQAQDAVTAYVSAVEEIGATQKARLDFYSQLVGHAEAWDRQVAALMAAPALTSSVNRREAERLVLTASDLVKAARVAVWRMESTGDTALRARIDEVLAQATTHISSLKALEGAASLPNLDSLSDSVSKLQSVIRQTSDTTQKQTAPSEVSEGVQLVRSAGNALGKIVHRWSKRARSEPARLQGFAKAAFTSRKSAAHQEPARVKSAASGWKAF